MTWVKTSPGGKLSNKNGAFSAFRSSTPPSWTAYRNNRIHNFGRLVFSADGRARYEAHGVIGDGTPPVLIDSFEYRLNSECPSPIQFDPGQVTLSAETGESVRSTVQLTSNGSTGAVSLVETAPWLTVTPMSPVVPGSFELQADPAGLAPGAYSASVAASGTGFADATLQVRFDVGGGYGNYVSFQSNRTDPVLLGGQTVAGNVFVFTLPTTLVARVDFYLDDPSMTRSPDDFAGGSASAATPFDTSTLAAGSHVITARVQFTDGTATVLHATFLVERFDQDAYSSRAAFARPLREIDVFRW